MTQRHDDPNHPLDPASAFARKARDRRNRLKPLKQWAAKQRRLKLIGWGVASLGGAALLFGFLGLQYLDRRLPDPKEILTYARPGTITIKAADDSVLQQVGPVTHEKLDLQDTPELVVNAFVAAEDRRFYAHHGVDLKSIVRAMTSNLWSREVVQGGSTITQQLARLVFLNQDRTFKRKLKEALLAQKIDRELSKDDILEHYLNLVYLGAGAYGVKDAAWVYFSKDLDELTLPEAATIAGMPAAPSDYSPLENPELAKNRRDRVLEKMADAGYISDDRAEAAKRQPLKLDPSLPKRLQVRFPYFTTYVQQEVARYIKPEQIEAGGLVVETSLNPKWQQVGEEVVRDAAQKYGSYEGFDEAALVAIDPKSGEIKTMVGGSSFEKSQFNRVTQALRQPGSTFKGIVYTAAIAAGFSPYESYKDAPFSVDGYQPLNAGRTYAGSVALRDALTRSINVVAIKLLIDVGFNPTIKIAKQMGIKSELKPIYTLALGSLEVTLLEMTNAYGTLANQGQYIEAHGIRRILNREGEVLYSAGGKFAPTEAVDKESAAIVTWMLENVVNSGTGRPAQLDRGVAGKTGTSDESRDLWFIGYIPQLVTGVWLGNDDNAPTSGESGSAAQTWHNFMVKAVEGLPVEKFPDLPNLDGRKGTIKAEPVKPGEAYSSEPTPDEQKSESGGASHSEDAHYEESSPSYYEGGNYSGESAGDYGGQSSGYYYDYPDEDPGYSGDSGNDSEPGHEPQEEYPNKEPIHYEEPPAETPPVEEVPIEAPPEEVAPEPVPESTPALPAAPDEVGPPEPNPETGN
jgi:penicillin-binding protein 1A